MKEKGTLAPGDGPYHTHLVPSEDLSNWTELLISLHSVLVFRREEMDDYDNQYVRKFSGPVKARFEESGNEVEIGQIELWHIDGSRAQDDGLDIVDVCDSLGQTEYEYASAVYINGSVDSTITQHAVSNDVLVAHTIALSRKYQDRGLEIKIIRKIGQTLAYHSAAVVFNPVRVGLGEYNQGLPTISRDISYINAS